jgi:hypothetical protein
MTAIVDTNVILVANGQHQGVSPACVMNCTQTLQVLMLRGRIAIDDRYRILKEYQNKTQPSKGKGPGDAFLKWVLRNNLNPNRCDRVPIVEHPERGFENFPDDPALTNFDPPDRMFVAVAAAHPQRPPILQAADSKWLGWALALEQHGIRVEFICRDDIERFRDNKL